MEGSSTMYLRDPLYAWTKELTKTFPDLSKPQLKGLAEWSFGMILARCCSLDRVASYMAAWLGLPELPVRSGLRDWGLPGHPQPPRGCRGKHKSSTYPTAVAPCVAR